MPKLLAVLFGATIGAAAGQTPAPIDIRDRLDGYLAAYEPALSALVARERMTQTIQAPVAAAQLRFARPTIADERKLESEVAFMPLPGDFGWMGIRVVRKVDGKPVATKPDTLANFLRSDRPLELANQILADSARYNLGSTRNTNLPNLPLELLHPRHRERFSYAIEGRDRINRVNVSILTFEEIGARPLIRAPDGTALISHITAWVDDKGRLLRAEVRSRASARRLQDEPVVRVEFSRHQALDLMVPSEMREQFPTTTRGEMGVSVAKYSDFRRFETSARIVPQLP